ncbi:unnamed protein product [Protopolystoma xenopodis]|uniref:Uncharacterized protein n=1 Tax=Protopolystoma xenopodis TaxID=117903 RepID=A0A448WGP7_9PLAT|nr:unnamed protein product [Protopolystoma xenopodis]
MLSFRSILYRGIRLLFWAAFFYWLRGILLINSLILTIKPPSTLARNHFGLTSVLPYTSNESFIEDRFLVVKYNRLMIPGIYAWNTLSFSVMHMILYGLPTVWMDLEHLLFRKPKQVSISGVTTLSEKQARQKCIWSGGEIEFSCLAPSQPSCLLGVREAGQIWKLG